MGNLEEPTAVLRFVKRDIVQENGPDATVKILQQLWHITTYQNGRPHVRIDEWRDVPLVEAQ